MIRVMTDGCFDPLHDGHLAYFDAARALGDHLIVNIASDEDLWTKRPHVGPLLPRDIRAKLISALRVVDEVTTHDTADALSILRPDIYAKGIDWKGRLDKEEQSICGNLGIEVRFLDTITNSSTSIIEAALRRGLSRDEDSSAATDRINATEGGSDANLPEDDRVSGRRS